MVVIITLKNKNKQDLNSIIDVLGGEGGRGVVVVGGGGGVDARVPIYLNEQYETVPLQNN